MLEADNAKTVDSSLKKSFILTEIRRFKRACQFSWKWKTIAEGATGSF